MLYEGDEKMSDVKRERFVKTLTSVYKREDYLLFLKELLTNMNVIAPDKDIEPFHTFAAAVSKYSHIGNYVGDDNKKVALFSVCLKNDKNLENARSMQRNFVKSLLESSDCAGALVSFYTAEEPDKWRLSFVRMDYEFSKGKINKKLTPAKRYSYLVGAGEPCHTAQERLYPIFADDNRNPSLDELEEAFSVEAVTKEFFDKYRDKYLDLKECLEGNPQFMAEAESRGFDSEQFAKKLMGQIVFLYFIQKKGWLGVNSFPYALTEKQYKDAFYSRGQKPKELMPKVYKLSGDGRYIRDTETLLGLSDEDETELSKLVKGDSWGDGPRDFMRQIFAGCEESGKSFFDDYLEPLFYTGLNKKRDNDFFPPLHRKIPFLNGGLFEELDGYDWRNNDFSIPNSIFSNATEKGRDADGILDVFDRYNFTMAEDEPMEREVAIDPEMLGKVFENLLDISDRKSKGAFYTPREIVHYMCQETLIQYLAEKTLIANEDIRKFILLSDYFRDEDVKKTKFVKGEDGGKGHYEFDYDKDMEIPESILSYKKGVNRLKEIDNLLANIKVVDMAVGSGAFPLGMLNEIVKARDIITTYMTIEMNGRERLQCHVDRNLYNLKRSTIKNCIFACDIEASATDITKLRLWLSLVIDNQIMKEENLELGYSTKPRELPNLECNVICGNSLIDEYKGIKLFTENVALNNESEYRQGNLIDQSLTIMINELIELQSKLYDEKDHTEKASLNDQIQDIYNKIVLEQIQYNSGIVDDYYQAVQMPSQPFILWQLYFPKVFRDNGGFDIVIGNPPYGARFSAADKKILNRIYEGCNVPDYESADFFIELGKRLIRENGTLSFIIPNMFMANLFAEKYRRHLLQTWHISKIDNLSEIDVFDSASVRNCIVFFNSSKRDGNSIFSKLTIENGSVKAIKDKQFSEESLIDHIDNWLNLIEKDETALSITNKMISSSKPLTEFSDISQGLIPYDKYRGHTPEQIKNKVWNANYQKDDTYRKELRGKDVDRYSIEWNGIDWISYGEWLAAPRKPEFFNSPRILVREITSPRILATYTDEEFYNTPSIINCINFKVDIFFVLGVVNSELMSFYHNMISPKASKGLFPKILVNDVRNLPINTSDEKIIGEIALRVKKLLEMDGIDPEIDSQIDELVYELYSITPEEREYINNWFIERQQS